jgi:hypothetical protein
MKQFIVKLVKVKQFIVEANDMDEAENIAMLLDEDKEEDISWVNMYYDEIQVEQYD